MRTVRYKPSSAVWDQKTLNDNLLPLLWCITTTTILTASNKRTQPTTDFQIISHTKKAGDSIRNVCPNCTLPCRELENALSILTMSFRLKDQNPLFVWCIWVPEKKFRVLTWLSSFLGKKTLPTFNTESNLHDVLHHNKIRWKHLSSSELAMLLTGVSQYLWQRLSPLTYIKRLEAAVTNRKSDPLKSPSPTKHQRT